MLTKWKIDPSHSEVQFKVKHLMITSITGSFTSFDLSVETEEYDFTKASKINFSADVDSITTGNTQRDSHLKSGDFFNASEYSQIIFKGTGSFESGDGYQLKGDLTIRGVTNPITLDVEPSGIVVDPYKQTKAGFSVTGKINRKDFGLSWSGTTESGSIIVSDEVKIACEVQLIKVD